MLELSDKQQLAYMALHSAKSKFTRVFYGGAAGGGKTYLGCAFQCIRRMEYPNTKGFIARKVSKDLIESTFETFQRVYKELCYPRIGEMDYNGQRNIIKFPNGSKIQLMHLEESPGDPEFNRLGSYEFTDGFIDEVGECSKSAVDVLFSRIRYNLINDKPALLIASNPTYGWLKETWIESNSGVKSILPEKWKHIIAKVNDNPDKEFVKKYIENLQDLPDYHRLRLLDGDWNYQINTAPYYPEYTANSIKERLEYNPDKFILIACDFNYSPATAVLIQAYDGYINYLKVIQAEGGTIPLGEKLIEYFKNIGWTGSFRLTGDSSGHKRDTRSGIETDYSQLSKLLNLPAGWVNHNNRSNTALDRSRDLINLGFHSKIIRISRFGCPELIQDLNIAKPLNEKTSEFKKDRDRYKMDVLDAARYGYHYYIKTDNDVRIFNTLYK